MKRAAVIFLLLASFSFCACARKGSPAPVSDYGFQPRQEMTALVRKQNPAPIVPVLKKEKRVAPVASRKKAYTLKSPSAPVFVSARLNQREKGPMTAFIWPVRGRVVSGYGAKPGGVYNDGINIAAPKNAPVLAAAAGTVAYVGNKLGGYGNLVLIRHTGGIMTAYAHLSSVGVKQGVKVKKGQVIGTVGKTGGVASPQLHFEIRKGGDAVDPRGYLG